MVNVKYVGDRPEVNVRVLGSLERGWAKGEVRVLSDEQADALESNAEFEVVRGSKAKKTDVAPVVKEDVVLVDDEDKKDEYIVEE